MLCSIVKFDPRFLEYDLDVIAGLSYEMSKDGTCTRLDVMSCNSTTPKYSQFDRETILRCPLIVIPISISDIFPGIIEIGEVYADILKVRDFWWWSINPDFTKLIIQDFYRRLRYLEEMT